MARNKMKKATKVKRVAKAQISVKSGSLMLIKKVEQAFKEMPITLVKQYRENLGLLKTHEKDLKNRSKKALAEKAAAKQKYDTLTAKSTPAAKKKLILAKKTHDDKNKVIISLKAELEQVKKYGKMLSQNQARFVAISKQLKLEKLLVVGKKSESVAKKRKESGNKKKVTKDATKEIIARIVDMPATVQAEEVAELTS